MPEQTPVLEYKCPCCDAPLIFAAGAQQMICEYCDNTFDLETIRSVESSKEPDVPTEVVWEKEASRQWNQTEENTLRSFVCDACGGELLTDDHTAATFCPYCGNPAILPGRLSGAIKPDGVIPFQTTREDAKAAFLKLCKGKTLLPKFFTQEQQLEKITGLYVPFWLYDCSADFDGSYRATRIRTWVNYFEDPARPQTRLDRDLEGGMAISIGRLRKDPVMSYKFVCLSHNTLRGAAGGGVLSAEYLCKMGYIPHK